MVEFGSKYSEQLPSPEPPKPPTLLEELRSIRWDDVIEIGSVLRDIATADWRSSTTLGKAVTIGATIVSTGVIAKAILS